jgi:hypothetical protein
MGAVEGVFDATGTVAAAGLVPSLSSTKRLSSIPEMVLILDFPSIGVTIVITGTIGSCGGASTASSLIPGTCSPRSSDL